jgi:UPF0042 nucleotide-binding protein
MEDAGFEAVDNLPLGLVPRLLDEGSARPLALGIDVRNREFSVEGTLALLDALRGDPDRPVALLYLDCAAEVLARRFSETRRRHPMAPDEDVETGIARERALLAPLAEQAGELADAVIDTTDLSPHELKARLTARFGPGDAHGLAISIQSYSYKGGLPASLDLAFDMRFLRNPHWVPALRPLTGQDAAVAAHIRGDPAWGPAWDRLRALLATLLPAYRAEGRAHLAVGFGCTGGRHRSVAMAEAMAAALAEDGWRVSIRHRELAGGARPPTPRPAPSAGEGGQPGAPRRPGIEGAAG